MKPGHFRQGMLCTTEGVGLGHAILAPIPGIHTTAATHYVLATTCKYDRGSDRRVADVAFECITQFTVEGNWDLCKSISKRCCNSRIRITSSVRDARPEVTVHFLTGMKSSSESEALVSWD